MVFFNHRNMSTGISFTILQLSIICVDCLISPELLYSPRLRLTIYKMEGTNQQIPWRHPFLFNYTVNNAGKIE